MELSVDMNVLLLYYYYIIFIKIRKGGWTGCFSAGTLYSTYGINTSTYEERGGWVPNRYNTNELNRLLALGFSYVLFGWAGGPSSLLFFSSSSNICYQRSEKKTPTDAQNIMLCDVVKLFSNNKTKSLK